MLLNLEGAFHDMKTTDLAVLAGCTLVAPLLYNAAKGVLWDPVVNAAAEKPAVQSGLDIAATVTKCAAAVGLVYVLYRLWANKCATTPSEADKQEEAEEVNDLQEQVV